jgi:glycosyltransferase involved in cell wall biosynthesis
VNIGIVHDWFLGYHGSERVVESFNNIWEEAPIYTLADFLIDEERRKIMGNKKPVTTFIQNLPFASRNHRIYLPWFPLAIEQLDLSEHEVVLSSSHSIGKGVVTGANQLHVSYCHTPMRYAWDLYHQYLKEAGIKGGLKGFYIRNTLHKLRIWDYTTTNRVDYFIANSKHVAKRIKKIYGRDSTVIYPPVDVDKCIFNESKEDYYLTAARFVPYKRVDLIVRAFSQMPDKKLIVIGEGPDEKRLKSLASVNIEFLPRQPYEKLIDYISKAKAFLFGAEEDFGITIVEALACGTPVIAYSVGGASETVEHLKTGILFDKQNTEAVINAVKNFERNKSSFEPEYISESAQKYSRKNFEIQIKEFVENKYKIFFGKTI